MGQLFGRDFQRIQPVAHDEQCVDDKCKCFDSDNLRVCEVRVCDLPTACVDTLCRCNDRMVEEISRYPAYPAVYFYISIKNAKKH